MANDLVAVEKSFAPYLPAFAEVLAPVGLPAERLVRTVMISCERTPRLMEASRQSLINSTMTAAVLGLEVDGVTGQGFLIPYNVRDQGLIAQFQIGYKGYPTIAARSGLTINASVIREGDEYDFREGTAGYVHHKRKLASRDGRKILAAWAIAEALGRPPIVALMSYDDILAIKAKSPGAKKQDSPWNDIGGPGHEAMCGKTAVRRLGRLVPLSMMQRAAALEDHHDMGHAAYLRPDGGMILEGNVTDETYPARQPLLDGAPAPLEPPFQWLYADGTKMVFPNVETWEIAVMRGIERSPVEMLPAARERNKDVMMAVMAVDQEAALRVSEAINRKVAG